MKIYLVGGAVRDQLLGYPVHERDWVVVGATPAQLIQQNYRSVGLDFPVFLHPETREEYALARTERKQGHGYRGFSMTFDDKVTLEEDLLRRDLTINAMARDDGGHLIDPYGGQADLKARLFRHVSPAFAEDPVRVLRVARLMARYRHLGFRLAEETRCLMMQIVQAGELAHLVPERVWQEWQRSLLEKNPECFIEILRAVGALKVILPELDQLFGVPNTVRYHPEVDTGIHSMQLLQQVSIVTPDPCVRFAALVHDLGKGVTPISAWPRHLGHEHTGLPVLDKVCQRLRVPKIYRQLAALVIRYHLLAFKLHELHPNKIVDMLSSLDAFRRPQRFKQWLLACECDEVTRGDWLTVLEACLPVNIQQWLLDGLCGEALKVRVHQYRMAKVKETLKQIKPEKKNEK
jgi:tRNA nucleotidyltransferase (CCA-adding enzyme)